jgi:hypothetical protein
MKHSTAETLASIDSLLQQLRSRKRLVERTPGAFYFKSRAFLHFHHDPSGTYADVKSDRASFTRMRCMSQEEQRALLSCVDLALGISQEARASGRSG